MRVTIYGAGYVGLVTATCFASLGHEVLCVENNKSKLEILLQGDLPIYEPGIDKLLKQYVNKNLHFTDDCKQAVDFSTIQIIAVGTPESVDGTADMQYVKAVAKNIALYMFDYKCIVTKSTVPVGTADMITGLVKAELELNKKQVDFDVCSNPEFLREGVAVTDFLEPDRIVVGVKSDKAKNLLRDLYQPIINDNSEKLLVFSPASAELTKYAGNAMLATKISFINQLSQLADKLGADIEDVKNGIAMDKRIGPHFINPGCGYGGSCFPKDVTALIKLAEQNKVHCDLLAAVDTINDNQKLVLVEKIKRYYKNNLAGKCMAVWGLAFKPNTDDVREAPSLVIIRELINMGVRIQAFDPVAVNSFKNMFGYTDSITYSNTSIDSLEGADALVILTEWDEFIRQDLKQIAHNLKDNLLVDGRNIYSIAQAIAHDINYISIGRETVKSNNRN